MEHMQTWIYTGGFLSYDPDAASSSFASGLED
jgi:hypothetical protein